jgi:NADH:ubiquinone oxidoreductase subunit F (NADH-binding)
VSAAPAAQARRPAPPPGTPRLIAPDSPLGLAAHLDRYGPVPFSPGPASDGIPALIAEAERAGLTGRGGAGFPAARKMLAVARQGRAAGRRRAAGTVVVANGAESEPASGKDRLLLARAPHLVLDGLVLAAEAVGAVRGYLCVHDGAAAGQLREAVAQRERSGLNRLPVKVVCVPGGYVSSQETALISHLNGGAPVPSFTPPLPHESGVSRRPTLVHNVETLAHLALIARFGARWFRAIGTAAAPGSALVTVSGAAARPGVYEVALGTTIGELVERAGGSTEPVQAVLAGGYFGGWLGYQQALRLPFTDAALRPAGAALGPGVLVLLPESACGLAETARAAWYLASQSAGQCGPCLNGLPSLAEAAGHIAFGKPDADLMRWTEQLLGLVTGRGACRLPDGTAALAGSALRVFAGDLHGHLRGGPCGRAANPRVLPVPGYPADAP